MEKVVAYTPGALIGHKLRQCCECSCHSSRFGMMHMFSCCETVPGFKEFPQLDADGTPVAKLPPCPNCEDDELGVITDETVLCYKCGWKLVRGSQIGATT